MHRCIYFLAASISFAWLAPCRAHLKETPLLGKLLPPPPPIRREVPALVVSSAAQERSMTGTAAVSNAAAGWVENQRAVLRAARRRAPHAADSSRIDKMVRRTTHARPSACHSPLKEGAGRGATAIGSLT